MRYNGPTPAIVCGAPLKHDQYSEGGDGKCQRSPRPGHSNCSLHLPNDRPIEYPPEVPGRCNALKHRARWADPFKAERCQQRPVTSRNRCRMHGGTTEMGPTHHSYTHGRRSKYVRACQAALRAVAADDNLSLAGDIARWRRTLKDLETAADPRTRGLRLAIQAELRKMVATEDRRLVDRRARDSVTVEKMHVLLLQTVESIGKHVASEAERTAVIGEMQAIFASDEAFGIYVRRRAEELGISLDAPDDETIDPEEQPIFSLDALADDEDRDDEDDAV